MIKREIDVVVHVFCVSLGRQSLDLRQHFLPTPMFGAIVDLLRQLGLTIERIEVALVV
jgi:hypothetical protein